jgi:hypothetical protein
VQQNNHSERRTGGVAQVWPAHWFAPRAPRWAAPFTAIGFAATAPYGARPAAAGGVMWNVQACLSPDTFADVIVLLGA